MCPKKLRNLRTQLFCILWNLCNQSALFHLKRGSQWQQAALQAYSNYSLTCLAKDNLSAIKNCTIFLASSARKNYTCRVCKSKYSAGLTQESEIAAGGPFLVRIARTIKLQHSTVQYKCQYKYLNQFRT